MLHHQSLARRLQGIGLARRVGAGRGERVEQFVDQHGRRQGRTIAHAAPDIGQVQHFTRRQHEVEEQVAVVEPALAITRLRPGGHQVELGRPVAAGEGALVHADQAHDAVGQAAQRRQRGKGDRAAGHAAACGIVEQRDQRRVDHLEGQRGVEFGCGKVVGQRSEGSPHFAQVVGVGGAVADETVEHGVEQLTPDCARARLPERVAQPAQGVGVAPEGAERERRLPLGRRGADAAGEARLLRGPARRPGEEQAMQAFVQRMLRGRQAFALLPVQPPAHACSLHPVVDRLESALVQPEARRHRRLLQQVENAARGKTSGRQLQRLVKHLRHRVLMRAAQAGDAPRDAARRGRGAEHRLDQRRGAFQIGHQHHDV